MPSPDAPHPTDRASAATERASGPARRKTRPAAPAPGFADRMSDADALLWSIERDPALRSTIVCVWMLDGPPDAARLDAKLAAAVREIPRLRQRPVADALGLAPPRWEEDPNFDPGFHVRRVALAGTGSLRDLLDLAQPIGMQAFDRDRPLWELYVVDGLSGGRSGIVMKLHHAISDGVGLVRMTEGLVERTRDDAPARKLHVVPPPPPDAGVFGRIGRAARDRAAKEASRATRLATALGATAGRAVREPLSTATALARGAASVGRLLAPVTAPLSPVMTGRSLSAHYESVFAPLDALKRAGNAAGGTLNDAFVAAVCGGLRRYHEALGAPVDALRMNMPINVRAGERARDAGNQFVPVRFAVPISIADPAERIRAIHDLVAAQRAEPALPLVDEITAVLGSLPAGGGALVSGAMMKAIDFTTSNVPGPHFPVYVSGARIEHMFGFGPLAGAAANVTCFSYDGDLGIGINVDPAAVTDPKLFAECLRKGLDEVLAVA